MSPVRLRGDVGIALESLTCLLGTLKKLSNQAQAYHRLVTGRMLASHLDSQSTSPGPKWAKTC